MKKLRFFTGFLICLSLTACRAEKRVLSFTAMNTYMTMQVYATQGGTGAAHKAEEALNACRNEVFSLETILSTTIQGSDVYRINNSAGEVVSVNKTVSELVEFSTDMYKKTDGAFNPALYPVIHEWGFTTGDYKIPPREKIDSLLKFTDFLRVAAEKEEPFTVRLEPNMQLDFGAIGKGYAGDRVMAMLRARGYSSALIDFGGNVQTLGTKPDGSLWTVGIKKPWNAEGAASETTGVACAVKVRDKAVITSGGYERFFMGEDGKKYIHIFDPATGAPAQSNLESVTIIAESGTYADALSTSLFVMGKDRAINFWKNAADFDFILITKEREIIYSAGLEGFINPLYDFRNSSVISL